MNIVRNKHLNRTAGFILISTLALSACRDDDDESPAQSNSSASIRVLHLSPDAPSVDIFANGEGPVVAGLAFPSGTDYLKVPAGSYDFAVSAAGASVEQSVLNINDIALDTDMRYTAVAFNTIDGIQALALVDDLSGMESGNIRIRAIHTAAGVGDVDIWNIPAEGSPSPLIENFGFGAASDTLDLPSSAYTLGVDVDNDASPDLVFDIPALPAGTYANVFAVKDGDSVFLLAQLGGDTTVRIDPR